MSANEPVQSPPPARGGARVSMALSIVAIIVALAALAASLALPGPTGPAGATGATGPGGPPGPRGNGTLQAYLWDNTTTPISNLTCTHAQGANLTLSVPGAGTVIMSASVTVAVNHKSGTVDTVYLYAGTPSAYCSIQRASFNVTTSGTGVYVSTVSLIANYAIAGAGTYTFSLAANTSPGTTASFLSASMSAVYYPS